MWLKRVPVINERFFFPARHNYYNERPLAQLLQPHIHEHRLEGFGGPEGDEIYCRALIRKKDSKTAMTVNNLPPSNPGTAGAKH